MKIDPHVHTKGISLCSRVNYRDAIDEKKRAGYDAIVLTNHCQPWYYQEHERLDWVQKFLIEYNQAKNYGRAQGLKVFLGVEVSVSVPHWCDFLLYGVNEDFFYSSRSLFDLSQRQLFEYCNLNGVVMVQAHPFREGHSPADPEFMHGVEINLRPLDFLKREMVEEFAKTHNLLITCGSDYHSVLQDEFGGMIIPDSITDSFEMAKFLLESAETTLFFKDKIKAYSKS